MSSILEDRGKEFLATLRNKGALTRGFFKASAPQMLRGFINQSLYDRSNAQVYEYLKTDIWDSIPDSTRSWLVGYAPWPLEWLTVEWVRDVVAQTHPAIASSIDSSETLQSSIAKSIDSIRFHLS